MLTMKQNKQTLVILSKVEEIKSCPEELYNWKWQAGNLLIHIHFSHKWFEVSFAERGPQEVDRQSHTENSTPKEMCRSSHDWQKMDLMLKVKIWDTRRSKIIRRPRSPSERSSRLEGFAEWLYQVNAGGCPPKLGRSMRWNVRRGPTFRQMCGYCKEESTAGTGGLFLKSNLHAGNAIREK